MFGLGIGELVLILAIILLVFGGGKLPQLGAGLGEGIRNFRSAYRETKCLEPGEQQPFDVKTRS